MFKIMHFMYRCTEKKLITRNNKLYTQDGYVWYLNMIEVIIF